jgi:hypothetical protein
LNIEPSESNLRIQLIRRFLESGGPFQLESEDGFLFGDPDFVFQGIALPVEVLDNIYHLNFESSVSVKPKRLNPAAIIEECERLEAVINAMGGMQPGQVVDGSIAKEVKAFFLSRL